MHSGCGAWFDGEIVVLREDGMPDFNALQNAFVKRQISQLTYFLFDALFVDGVDLRGEALRTRRKVLEGIMAQHAQYNGRLSQTFTADGASVLASACKMGCTPTVRRQRRHRMGLGYRGRCWQPYPSFKWIGCPSIPDSRRPKADGANVLRGVGWVSPHLVVTVRFSEWTPQGHVWHPSFQGMKATPPATMRREYSR